MPVKHHRFSDFDHAKASHKGKIISVAIKTAEVHIAVIAKLTAKLPNHSSHSIIHDLFKLRPDAVY